MNELTELGLEERHIILANGEGTNVHESLFECPQSRSLPMRDADSTKADSDGALECPRMAIFHFTIEEIIDDLRFLFLHMRELIPN